MGQHDVQVGQCRTIFNTVDLERSDAITDSTQVLAELDELTGAARHSDLSAALQQLKQVSLEPQLTSTEQRLGNATGTGQSVMGILNQGDQESATRADSANSQAEIPSSISSMR